MTNSSERSANIPYPSTGSVYSHAWQQMKKYFLELLLVVFIGIVVQTPIGWPYANDFDNWQDYVNFTDRLFWLAYWILVVTPIEFGIALLFVRAARGEKVEFKEIITGFNHFVHVILARILVIGIVTIGIFLLIIPGIVFAVKLALVPYLVIDKKMDAIEAVKESWRLTNGHGWTIFGMALLAIPIFIAGLIVFIVGVIPALIWIQCAFASIYFALTGKEDSNNATPVEETT